MKPLRFIPIKFSEELFDKEGKAKKAVQLLRIGGFTTGKNAEGESVKVNVTKEDLDSMVKNFNEKVRGIDIMLDYSHNSDKEAAAWIEKIYTMADGKELWADVEWTKLGLEKVSGKEYKYISADFHPNYEDNETHKKFGPTLLGAGLTNRPVVKRMEPVILGEDTNQKYEGDTMPYDQEKEKEFTALKEENKKLKEKVDSMEAMMKKKEEEKMLADKKAEADKLLAEKNTAFDRLLTEKKVVEAQRKPFIDGDTIKFAELHAEVKTIEKGDTTNGNRNENANKNESAQDQLTKLADALVEKGGITLSEATRKVLRENKELQEKYSKETSA